MVSQIHLIPRSRRMLAPLSSQICFLDFEQRLTKKVRSFHTVWNVCAIAIPFHLQDHVLVARSIYMGLPERGRSEGDSFGNRRDLKISVARAIYTLVPSRLPPGNEEQ
jgi:hypothetical protein